MLSIHVQPPGNRPAIDFLHKSGAFEIGRAAAPEGIARCVITADPAVSRNHVQLEEIRPGFVRIMNISRRMPIWIENTSVAPGGSRLWPTPVTIKLGDTTVRLESDIVEPVPPSSIHSMASLGSSPMVMTHQGRPPEQLPDHNAAALADWMETLISVQQAPAGSKEFYQQTARVLVDHIGMDVGLVILHTATGWSATARHARAPNDDPSVLRGREFSLTVLEHVLQSKQTIFQSDDIPPTESVMMVNALVASPIILPSGDVAGALYGVQYTVPGRNPGIRPLDAKMVQVLATAVGVGLARVAQEEETARLRVRLDEQFNEGLARKLEADIRQLDPQDREISILFADIQNFSLITERLGSKIFDLISDVMEELTRSVKRHDGVVMDYVGDAIIAIWNAPEYQDDHARLAVECARELNADLQGVNKKWQGRCGEPVRVTVGINSGMARVGNTGTQSKPKYGALGHTVNVASRVQGATKTFCCSILLTDATLAEATRKGLPDDFLLRYFGCVKLIGINDPIGLHQIGREGEPFSEEFSTQYAQALNLFEAGDLSGAQEIIVRWLATAVAEKHAHPLAQQVQYLLSIGATQYPRIIELSCK